MNTKVAGIGFMALGIILLILNSQVLSLYAFFTWSFIFLLVGVLIIAIGFAKSNAGSVLLGGLLAAVCFFSWCKTYISSWPDHWSILLILISLAIILMFYVNKQPLTGILGGMLCLAGILAYPGLRDIPSIAPVSNMLNTYWPAVLVLLGLIFIKTK